MSGGGIEGVGIRGGGKRGGEGFSFAVSMERARGSQPPIGLRNSMAAAARHLALH